MLRVIYVLIGFILKDGPGTIQTQQFIINIVGVSLLSLQVVLRNGIIFLKGLLGIFSNGWLHPFYVLRIIFASLLINY